MSLRRFWSSLLREPSSPPSRFRPVCEELEDRTVPTTLPAGFVENIFATGLTMPTAMEFAPDGRLFVTEKGGQVRVITSNGALLPTPFLSVSVDTFSERGLESITFDPNFVSNRFVYVYYTTSGGSPVNRVSRFTASASDPNVALPGSEVVLLDNIPSTTGIHNGGALHFGTDGKLYIGVGESGVMSNSQTLSNLAGKILRINSDGSIPADNPFVGMGGARGEIWALGFRNPFTFAVQPGTVRIFVNDVGGNLFEEVDDLMKGGNYGWPTYEGPSNAPGFIDPIYSYPHNGQTSAITGGVFYQGGQLPAEFNGSYFFGDFDMKFIRRLTPGSLQGVEFATDAPEPLDLDIGPDGTLYYLTLGTGQVRRIRFAPSITPLHRTVVGSDAGGPPLVRVFDTASGALIAQFFAYDSAFQGGVHVATADVTGDGVPDIITGAGLGAGSHVKVFDGVTFTEIRSFLAYTGFNGGVFVAGGDVNGDGFADIITGATVNGHVKVFSGADNSPLDSFLAYPGFPGEVRVAAGDVNGDGRADIITATGAGTSHVKAFSGTNLALLSSFLAYPGYTAGVWVSAGDLDGDGRAEIITGTAGQAAPHVKAFDATGTLRLSFLAYVPGFLNGVRVGATDADNDGRAELLTSTGPGVGPHVKRFRFDLTELDSFFALAPTFTGGVFVAGV